MMCQKGLKTSANMSLLLRIFCITLLFTYGFIFAAFGQKVREGNNHPVSTRLFYVDSESGSDSNDGTAAVRAWRSLSKVNKAVLNPGDTVLFKRSGVWRGQLLPKSGDDKTGPVTYSAYGDGEKPLLLGSISKNSATDWTNEAENIWSTAFLDDIGKTIPENFDVGNIVYNHGKATGVKKWRYEELRLPYDYWYDAKNRLVKLYSIGNPAYVNSSIELALKRTVVQLNDIHHAVFDGLAVRYGAAHGFGGWNTSGLIIRNCDISYIGGGHQYTGSDKKPVRYGNGIEFWGAAHDNLVEGCRIWEIYDAALTNQGSSPDSKQKNITYQNNVIWNAEYSFEYWNRPVTAVTKSIHFIHNTCVNAGGSWAHRQRPDPNGNHLSFYSNSATTQNVEIKCNIFVNSTDWGLRFENDWRSGLDLDYNLWFQDSGIIANFLKTFLPAADFAGYQKRTGFDKHSIFTDPKFIAPAAFDFRLRPDSPGRSLCQDGGSVGAKQLAAGLTTTN